MADTNVFIADLPAEVDDAKLVEIFAPYGTITWSKVMPNAKGKPTQAAIVEFADIAEATWVVENLNGNVPEGLAEPVTVAFKRAKQDKGAGKGGWSDKGAGKGKGGWSDKGGKGGKGKGWSPY